MFKNRLLHLVVLHFFATVSLCAQTTWSLFSTHQRSYWQQGDTISRYDCDSATVLPNGATMHLIGGGYRIAGQPSPCFATILQKEYKLNKPPIDTFFSENNHWKTRLRTGQWLTFYPNTPVGQSWTVAVQGLNFDEVRFVCTRQTLSSVLGKSDSAKTFVAATYRAGQVVNTSWTGAAYELTKTHGFRQWYPFSSMHAAAPPVMTLAGMVRLGVRMGFTLEASDFFQQVKPGIILKYRIYHEGTTGSTEEIARDSVLSMSNSQNGIRIEVARRFARTTVTYIGQFPNHTRQEKVTYGENAAQWTFTNERFQRSLTPGWFGPVAGNGWEIYSPIHRTAPGGWRSSVRRLSWTQVSATECRPIWDGCYYSDAYSTLFGLVEENYTCATGTKQIKLLGFRGDSINWGDYRPITTSTRDLTHAFPLHLSPNPVSEILTVDFPGEHPTASSTYRVYNLTGQLVLTGQTRTTPLVLSVGQLPAGLYKLQFYTVGGQLAQGTFLKR